MAVTATAEQLQREAEHVATQLRERYPGVPEALHVVAMMRAQLRQTAEAEELWQECIRLAPDDERYSINLAAVAMERGQSELAAATLQQAVAAGSKSPDVAHHLGVALVNLGRCEEAETILEKALADYPQSAAHWLVLGQAQLKLGQTAEAEASLRQALALGAEAPGTYFALSNACLRQGKRDEAEQYRARYAELKATEPLDAQQRFQILSTAEARRTAVAVLTEAAAVHGRQQDTLEAERLLLRAVALDPAGIESLRALAGLYQAAGLLPEERVVRRRLAELEPSRFSNHIDLAQVSAQLGEREAAEAALKMAVTMQPDAAVAYATLAQFHLEGGKAKLARWYAQESLRRQPTAAGYRLLAATCRLLDDQETAAAALARAAELEQPPQLHHEEHAEPRAKSE